MGLFVFSWNPVRSLRNEIENTTEPENDITIDNENENGKASENTNNNEHQIENWNEAGNGNHHGNVCDTGIEKVKAFLLLTSAIINALIQHRTTFVCREGMLVLYWLHDQLSI